MHLGSGGQITDSEMLTKTASPKIDSWSGERGIAREKATDEIVRAPPEEEE